MLISEFFWCWSYFPVCVCVCCINTQCISFPFILGSIIIISPRSLKREPPKEIIAPPNCCISCATVVRGADPAKWNATVSLRLSQTLSQARGNQQQWPEQISFYHSAVQRLPRVAFNMLDFSVVLSASIPSIIKIIWSRTVPAVSTRNSEISPNEEVRTAAQSRHRTWKDFSPCIMWSLWVMYFALRPPGLSWTRIKVRPCLRFLDWQLSKGDCGSAGCPPVEATTPASSISPLKVWGFFCCCCFVLGKKKIN